MHFVISMFVAIVCLASLIIFKEILNKIISFIIGVIGCAGFAYAMAILIKKCGEWFAWWSGDPQYIYGNFLWLFAITFVVYIIVHFLLIKRSNKLNAKTEA
ncbi:hypothetical protein H5999_09030 [[Clostridium] spiroforme]|nr:hypothetical protein [Thomasclavelia spiroformis]